MNFVTIRTAFVRLSLFAVFLLCFAESFFYPGVIVRYLQFQPAIFIIGYLIIKSIDRFILKGKPFSTFFNLGFIYIAPILAVLVITFDIAERILYGNFVFTHFHIHPEPFVVFYLQFILLLLPDLDFKIVRKNIQKVLFVAPIYFYPILLLRFYYPSFNEWLKKENSLVEMIQLVLFFAAAFYSYKLFIITKKQYKTWKHLIPFIYLGLTIFFVVVGMEEISWGFNLLGITTPEQLAKHNMQNEINIHNNNAVFGGVYYAYGVLTFYCMFFWLFVKLIPSLKNLLKNMKLNQFVIPWYLSSYFLLNFIYVILRFNRFHPVLHEYLYNRLFGQLDALWEWEEYTELFLITGLFLFVFLLHKLYPKKPLNNSKYLP